MNQRNVKKRLFIFACIVALAIAAASMWLVEQNNKSYVVHKIAGTTLYVPSHFTGPKPDGLIAMLRAYIENQTNQQRYQATVSDLLDSPTNLSGPELETTLIWTISATDAPSSSVSMPVKDIELLTKVSQKAGPAIETTDAGLLKIYTAEDDQTAFSFSNINTKTNPATADIWISHCIRFRALREGNSWGRCSRQLHLQNFLLTIHYDGLVVAETAALSKAVIDLLMAWQTAPSN